MNRRVLLLEPNYKNKFPPIGLMKLATYFRLRGDEVVFYKGDLKMDEKTMVSDALVGVNGELKMFGDMIPQTENKELKQCLKQIRNQCEMSQEKLYQVAREKSYYVPAAKATQQEVDHVKSILTQPKMGL